MKSELQQAAEAELRRMWNTDETVAYFTIVGVVIGVIVWTFW